jgi:hypothetical protein
MSELEQEVNAEGLTREEWMDAAGVREPQIGVSRGLKVWRRYRRAVRAWRDGEDPTEWRVKRKESR